MYFAPFPCTHLGDGLSARGFFCADVLKYYKSTVLLYNVLNKTFIIFQFPSSGTWGCSLSCSWPLLLVYLLKGWCRRFVRPPAPYR